MKHSQVSYIKIETDEEYPTNGQPLDQHIDPR